MTNDYLSLIVQFIGSLTVWHLSTCPTVTPRLVSWGFSEENTEIVP